MFRRFIALFVTICFISSYGQPVNAQGFNIDQLPVPGTMVGTTAAFAPLALKGLIVNPQKPLEFQFIVDTGHGPQDTASIKDQANQLIKYFLAGLTIPEGDLWVNLSPYERNRIVPEALGQTDLGRDLLAQDYILKQLTASLIYPEKDLGKEFWSRVYAKAQARFGTTNVPVNTFNKVWILPNEAHVFENGNAAYVTKSTLKVMLDQDYLAKQKHMVVSNDTGSIGSQIVRAIILPEIENEVNTGKNFASLRQIYQALILAKWYKETIQNGLLNAVYTDKKKIVGVNVNDPAVKDQIYERYLKAYKKGAFNYIKEDPTPNGQVAPRKYFSGGTFLGNIPEVRDYNPADVHADGDDAMISLTVGLVVAGTAVTAYFLTRKGTTRNKESNVRSSPIQEEERQQILRGERVGIENVNIRSSILERREKMLRSFENYNFNLVSYSQILREPNILLGIHRLEENMGSGKMPEPMLTGFLANHGAKILIVTDRKAGEIVGYTFGLPQSRVPPKPAWVKEYFSESFYEISRQVLPKYQSQGIGSAMRMKLMQEAINEGFKYFASDQMDTFSEENLNEEIQYIYGLNGSLFLLKRRLVFNQQYLVFKLPDQAMSNTPKAKLLELIKSKDNDVMFNAARALSQILDQLSDEERKQAWTEVKERLHNPDPSIRQKAVVTLQSLGMDDTAINQAVLIGENYLRSKTEAQQRQSTDEAMRTPMNDKATLAEYGGIDLNQINVNRTGKIVSVHFDQAQLNELTHGDFEGFMPVIIGFKYIQSPLSLLEISQTK